MADFSAWARYKTIQVLNTNLDQDLDEFPLLVAFDDDPSIGAHARADGHDVRFTLDDGRTELSFERESFGVVAGLATGRFWVRVPELLADGPGGLAATIRCYYGNPDAEDASDAAATWGDNVFLLVTHMKDGASSSEVASALGPVGTKQAADQPAEDAGGMVNQAQRFNAATTDYVSYGTSVQPAGFVFEGWCQTSKTERNVFGSWTGGDRCGLIWYTTGKPIIFRDGHNFRYWDAAAGALITDGNWHHVAFVLPDDSQAAVSNAELLVDGVVQDIWFTDTSAMPAAKGALLLGDYTAGSGGPFDGLMDEVRISDPLSFPGATWTEKRDNIRAWLKFTWANIARSGHELLWGPETRPGGVGFHGAVAGGAFSTGAAAGRFYLAGAIAGSTR